MRYFIGLAIAILYAAAAVGAPPPPPPRSPVDTSPHSTAAPLTAAEERALKPKDAFKECAVCPEMVVVPAGSFMMGASPGEGGESDELPQRRVTIARPFAVGTFEASFAEWDACVAEGGCHHRPHDGHFGQPGWGRGKQPAINVSWNDVTQQYLPWLSRKTGKIYRLLTEAEWEYAARAGTSTPYWWGWSISPNQANYVEGSGYGRGTVPVDSYAPNPWGLYNVHGNVLEWVQDCWNGSYYGAPLDGSAWTSGNCSQRMLRGGFWKLLGGSLRSANRDWSTASVRDSGLGFRVARTLGP